MHSINIKLFIILYYNSLYPAICASFSSAMISLLLFMVSGWFSFMGSVHSVICTQLNAWCCVLCCRQYRPKLNVTFLDNGTKVSAYTVKSFVFLPEKSVGDPKVDMVTTVNIPAVVSVCVWGYMCVCVCVCIWHWTTKSVIRFFFYWDLYMIWKLNK